MATLAERWRAILGRPGHDLVKSQLSNVERRTLASFAYEPADLLRDQRVTREQALAAIADRFPELTPKQVARALAQGLFESR